MPQPQLRSTGIGRKALAVACVLAALAVPCVPHGWSADPPPTTAAINVAVIPFVFAGRVDDALTTAFVEKLTSSKSGWKVADAATVQQNLARGAKFRSDGPIPALLKAAKAAGADAVILGTASSYKFLDAPGVKLRVRMLDAKAGEERHRVISEESAWSAKGAKEEAARTAAKKLDKQVGGK